MNRWNLGIACFLFLTSAYKIGVALVLMAADASHTLPYGAAIWVIVTAGLCSIFFALAFPKSK